MILIDRQTAGAIHEDIFRTRYPQLTSARGIVGDRCIIEFVLSRAGALAGNIDLLPVRAYSEVIRSIGAASTKPTISADPLLGSVSRVVGDRDVVKFTGRGCRNPTDID